VSETPAAARALLVVDDDPAILALLTRYLAPHGYAVQGVLNETDALDLAVDPRSEWAGVIVDATLPMMQHGLLLTAIREALPDIPIVVTSAFDAASVRFLISRAIPTFLAKPFSASEALASLISAGIHPPEESASV
jgi:DNA-binding response OmpR family regulator